MIATNSISVINLQEIATAINNEHGLAVQHAGTSVEHARRAGELLLQAKEAVGHGGWLEWVWANCGVSARQAQKYMRIARANTTRGTHLTNSLRAALAELAAPRQPKPALPEPEFAVPPPKIAVYVGTGHLTMGLLNGKPIIAFQESRQHSGYWYCHDFQTDTVNTRPICAAAAGHLLNDVVNADAVVWHLVDDTAPISFAESEGLSP